MSALEIANWIAIYAATAICCAIAMVLAVSTVAYEAYQERVWVGLRSRRQYLMLAPQLWWRWQKRYLLSTPMTLIIIAWFAATLDWSG